VEKRKFLTLPGLELRPLGRPACGQLQYLLRYPGPSITKRTTSELLPNYMGLIF
jgi:hypothetical protein